MSASPLPRQLAEGAARLSARAASAPLAIVLATLAQGLIISGVHDTWSDWLYLLAIAVLILSAGSGWSAHAAPDQAVRHKDAFATALLVIGALTLRLILIDQHPGLFGDEGERGMSARAILEGARPPLFAYGWWGVPNVYFYLVSEFLRVAGDSILGLRLLSPVSGTVAVFFVARIGRLLFGSTAGLVAGTLLAVSPVALQFSRVAGESTPTGALWAAGFFFLFRALYRSRLVDAVVSGFCLGASLYFYASAKLLLLLVPILVLYLLIVAPYLRARVMALAVAGAFAVTILPIAISSWKDPQGFGGRFVETSIFSTENRPIAFGDAKVPYSRAWNEESSLASVMRHPLEWIRVLAHQIRSTVDVLYRSGDPTAFYQPQEHRGSLLSLLAAPVVLLGLAWGARNLFDPRFFLLGLWFWGGLLGPILTINTPSVQRLASSWPATMLFAGALFACTTSSFSGRVSGRIAAGATAAWILAISVMDVREYFVSYRALAPYGDVTAQARHIAALGSAYKAYGLGVDPMGGEIFVTHGSTRFLAKGVEAEDVGALPTFLPITNAAQKGADFLVYPSNAIYLPLLRLFYPEGDESRVSSQDGIVRFTSYKVDGAALTRSRMPRVTYLQPNGLSIERDESWLGTLGPQGTAGSWAPPLSLLYPSKVRWDGAFVSLSGERRFVVKGTGDAELWIDGRLVAKDGGPQTACTRMSLAGGLHDVRLSGTLVDPKSRIVLLVDPPGDSAKDAGDAKEPIERRMLFRRSFGGLSAEVWRADVDLDSLPSSPPDQRRVDPFLGFREAHTDSSLPQGAFVARWRGMLTAQSAGRHILRLRSFGESRLFLDGREVARVPARGEGEGEVILDREPHAIEVRYASGRDRAQLELLWIPPLAPAGLVPPGALSPEWRSGPARACTGY